MYPPPPPPLPPPPPPRSHRRATLILKLLTFVFLLAALVVLTTDTGTIELPDNTEFSIHFKDMYTYRYLLGACVAGMAYTLLQIVLSLCNIISTGNRLSCPTFDFYGDKVLSYMLATGAAAGFGATRDMKSAFEGTNSDNFFDRGYAASALVFIGFVCAAFLSIFSSYALPKKV